MKLRELLETEDRIRTVRDRERHDFISLARDFIHDNDEIVYAVANHYGVNDSRLSEIKQKLWFQKAVAKVLAKRANQEELFVEDSRPVVVSVLYNMSPSFTGTVAKQFFKKIATDFHGQISDHDSLGIELTFPDLKSATKAESIIHAFALRNQLEIDAQITH